MSLVKSPTMTAAKLAANRSNPQSPLHQREGVSGEAVLRAGWVRKARLKGDSKS